MANDKEEGIKVDKPLVCSITAGYTGDLVPYIELRRYLSDPDMVKGILLAAMNDTPIVIYPTFKNKILGINKLQELGILKRMDGELQFTI